MQDEFFTKTNCDRCKMKLDSRTVSWFTEETICDQCSSVEDRIKSKMRESGIDPSKYEGCGEVPKDFL